METPPIHTFYRDKCLPVTEHIGQSLLHDDLNRCETLGYGVSATPVRKQRRSRQKI